MDATRRIYTVLGPTDGLFSVAIDRPCVKISVGPADCIPKWKVVDLKIKRTLTRFMSNVLLGSLSDVKGPPFIEVHVQAIFIPRGHTHAWLVRMNLYTWLLATTSGHGVHSTWSSCSWLTQMPPQLRDSFAKSTALHMFTTTKLTFTRQDRTQTHTQRRCI